MKILVTGANGQLGKSIRKISADYPGMQFIFTDVGELDILNEPAVSGFISEKQPEILINCAAYTAVDRAEKDEDAAMALNAEAPGILARHMAQSGGRMIHISTDYVFDGKNNRAYHEDDPVKPSTVYGKSKLLGEKEVTSYPSNLVVRTSWLYSIYGNNFFKTMLRLMDEKDEINVVSDQYGSPTFATDLAETLLFLSNRIKRGNAPGGIYHYSNDGSTNWYGFAREIARLHLSDCRINGIHSSEYPSLAVRPAFSLLNKDKIKNTFGIIIPDWKDSLKACYKLYRGIKQ